MTRSYDPDAPLFAAGTHLLEASAGTGKTHAIKNLVARYILETDITIDQMLIMTFGRSATQELRDRVRTELWARWEGAAGGDRAKLEAAVSNLDAASISTTHEFCSAAFARLGIRADKDPHEQLSDDLTDLRLDAASDVYLTMFAGDPSPPLTSWAAGGVARTVVADPVSGLHVPPPGSHEKEVLRHRFAENIRRAVRAQQRTTGLVSYDDLVLRLRDALTDPELGPAVAQLLRDRYKVVLIDEFQDTDPAQWQIVERAFHGHAIVLLIGDPKQGIYAFRGADINSYLAAGEKAADLQTLTRNHRSDRAVVDGVGELLQFGTPPSGLALGDPRIVVHPITARIAEPRLTGGNLADARRVRLRVLDFPKGAAVGLRRRAVAADVARDAARLLASRPTLSFVSDPAARCPEPRRLAPGDIAVIVRTNDQAAYVKQALADAGVHAVVNSVESVFGSPAGYSLLCLLRALERPRPNELRRALLCGFFEQTPEQLVSDPDAALSAAAARVHRLNDLYREHGMAALSAAVLSDEALLVRSLRRADGERYLTDLRHLCSLLQHESGRRRGLSELIDWLAQERSDAGEGPEQSESRTRRLESDADAVQVVTIHRAKGLQYPVTYVPYGWDGGPRAPRDTVRFTAPGRGREIDVRTAEAPGRAAHAAIALDEAAGEDLRMLYVALTRASSLVVVTAEAGPPKRSRNAPLDRVLFARHRHEAEPAGEYQGDLPPLEFEHVLVEGPVDMSVPQDAPEPPDREGAGAAGGPPPLAAAAYDRDDIDTAWDRRSFSGIIRGSRSRAMPSEPVDDQNGEKDDEPDGEVPADPGAVAAGAMPSPLSPMADLPAGTSFGTLVHAVFEHVDTSAADLAAEVHLRCGEQLALRPVAGLTADVLAPALLPSLRTPLGRLAPGATLAGIAPGDRLAELDFELPLHQGPRAAATVGAIGELLAGQDTEPGWVRAYGQSLLGSDFTFKQLRGYLTGSIDAVLRVDGRYVVVDYKSNRLGGPDGALYDYRPEALPAVMAEAHYVLQALLYSAALHRFLTHRLAGYEPGTHLGGILYLFVRGMAGPDTPVGPTGDPCGVFSWRPDPALVLRLSALLGGERR